MSRVLDVPARGIGSGLGDHLANRRLHFIGIRLGLNTIEVEIKRGLIDTIEVLKVGEGNEPPISKSLGLIWRELGLRKRTA